jgi:hypothetical protein
MSGYLHTKEMVMRSGDTVEKFELAKIENRY